MCLPSAEMDRRDMKKNVLQRTHRAKGTLPVTFYIKLFLEDKVFVAEVAQVRNATMKSTGGWVVVAPWSSMSLSVRRHETVAGPMFPNQAHPC